METEYRRTLTHPQALVLFIVWKARQSPLGLPGLTNVQVQEAFAKSSGSGKGGASLANIKVIMDALKNWEPSPLLTEIPRSGKAAVAHKLSDHVIRWATAATMVLELEHHTEDIGVVDRSLLVQRMVGFGLKNSDGTPFGPERIELALNFCIAAIPSYVRQTETHLVVTARVESERRYLNLLRDSLTPVDVNPG